MLLNLTVVRYALVTFVSSILRSLPLTLVRILTLIITQVFQGHHSVFTEFQIQFIVMSKPVFEKIVGCANFLEYVDEIHFALKLLGNLVESILASE